MSVLAKSHPYRGMPIAAAQHMLVPAIMTRQFAIMNAVNGQQVPVAAAFWAHVSPEVDARLSDTTVKAPKLDPKEWRSGDIPWLIDVVGHPAAGRQLMAQLKDGPFKGRDVKMRHARLKGDAAISNFQNSVHVDQSLQRSQSRTSE